MRWAEQFGITPIQPELLPKSERLESNSVLVPRSGRDSVGVSADTRYSDFGETVRAVAENRFGNRVVLGVSVTCLTRPPETAREYREMAHSKR